MTHMELVVAASKMVGFIQRIVHQFFTVISSGTNEELGRLLLVLLSVYVLLMLLARMLRAVWGTVVFIFKVAFVCVVGIFAYTAYNYGLEPALNLLQKPVVALPLGIDFDFVLRRVLHNYQ